MIVGNGLVGGRRPVQYIPNAEAFVKDMGWRHTVWVLSGPGWVIVVFKGTAADGPAISGDGD